MFKVETNYNNLFLGTQRKFELQNGLERYE